MSDTMLVVIMINLLAILIPSVGFAVVCFVSLIKKMKKKK